MGYHTIGKTYFSINLCLVLLLLWSGVHWYTDSESNRCILTRMMDFPEYDEVNVDCKRKCYLGYALYQYREGSRFRSRLYNSPVLFITGSQGSFKTVRSLATTIQNFPQYSSSLDYYSVDFNEEPSALSGEIIERQTDFVDKAIDTILGTYANRPNPPEHIVLIGHSVGSIVIFNLLSSRWNITQTKVKLVLSLAGPIYQPVILPDRSMAQIYQRIHNYLDQISNIPNYPLVIISITGGSRDRIVPDLLGNIDQAYPALNSLSLSTSAIQYVWASCDHRCILWCLQLMLVLNKGLLVHNSLSSDPISRLNVFRNLLITRPLLTHTIHHDQDNDQESNFKLSQTISSSNMFWIDKTNQTNSIMNFYVPYNGLLVKFGPFFINPEQHILILASHVPEDWLHLCIKTNHTSNKHCDYFVPIPSSFVTLLPNPLTGKSIAAGLITLSMLQKLHMFHNLSLLLTNQDSMDNLKLYLVVSTGINPFWDNMTIFVDTFDKATERIHSDLPYYSSISSYLGESSITTFNPNITGIFHRFYLPIENYYLSSSTIGPNLLIKRKNCSADRRFMGMVTLNTIWCNYFHYVPIGNDKTEISFQLPISSISFSNYFKESPSFIDFYLDPNCVYEVSVYYSLISWFSQLIRLHCTHFAGLLCGHLVLSLVILTFRLISFNEDHLTSISYHNFQSIIHEIYYHQAVVLIHFLSFQLISLPFSEWIELHQTGQLGLRLINTLQSLSIINFTNYIQIILNHLPLLIISIPYGFIIPLFNCILDKGFLLLSSSSQVIHRKDDSMMKQNDNLSVSSSTWIMNISTLCILSIAWLVTESLANITFNQQNSINNDNYQLLNIQKEIQKKSIKLINNQYQIKLYYYLYLIKYRIFIILIIISIYMLNDWILFIENIKFIDYR
uniref:GPI inositol-deacylase n=1 Tax=Schistosoma mansoni TaxID=6183 RepID=A0A5K4FBH1_SCHMA